MSRIGKIARLPVQIREQINLRLQDGENGRGIIAWLNSSAEVKAALAHGFADQDISDSNLAAWRRGGYRDWQEKQNALEEARRVMSEGLELEEAGGKLMADKLAVWLTGRYIVATRKLSQKGSGIAAWKLLRELCHDLVALRRGDPDAEWLRLDRERLEFYRQKDERHHSAATAQPPPDAPRPRLSDEEKEQKWREIFGMEPL